MGEQAFPAQEKSKRNRIVDVGDDTAWREVSLEGVGMRV